MRTLLCKRCEKEYRGDPCGAIVCDSCWDECVDNGWIEEEIIDSYSDDPGDDRDPAGGDDGYTSDEEDRP